MQQIAEWLAKLGMSEYAERFAENAIDFGVLPDLTDQDLKDIGVLLGHRRKLLRAIAELNEALPPKAAPPAAVSITPQDAAERRQITVMFSDLVGSTALAGRMDPEDLREVISAYQKCVAETVSRFGGFVAKYMGDGVLALERRDQLGELRPVGTGPADLLAIDCGGGGSPEWVELCAQILVLRSRFVSSGLSLPEVWRPARVCGTRASGASAVSGCRCAKSRPGGCTPGRGASPFWGQVFDLNSGIAKNQHL
jgi:hypothetical protein